MIRVDVWSDIVCPWCYIGKRRLERALEALDERDQVEVVYRSFELDPDAPAVGEPTLGHLAAKYGLSLEDAELAQQRVVDIARREGLDYHLAEGRRASSFDAHRLLHLAREHALQHDLKERLMGAYFTDAETIGDPAVLERLACETGLPADEVATALAGERFADAVRADERSAAEHGIRGVPFFVIDGKFAIEGAQPAEQILRGLRYAFARRAAAAPS